MLKKLRLLHRIKKLEDTIDILLDSKPKMLQIYNHNSTKLQLLNNNVTKEYVYGTDISTELFNTNIETESNDILDIKISASFIPTVSEMKEGSIVLKLIIDGTLLAENETYLMKDGYSHLTINHLQEVEEYGSYNLKVTYEGFLVTNNKLEKNPKISVKNDGSSLSVLIL